jgi:hypothetical protein
VSIDAGSAAWRVAVSDGQPSGCGSQAAPPPGPLNPKCGASPTTGGDAVALDPDVVFFRDRECDLSAEQKGYVEDMATICGYLATSDPPAWLEPGEREALAGYLAAEPEVRRLDRYRFSIDGREVDFSAVSLDDPAAPGPAR